MTSVGTSHEVRLARGFTVVLGNDCFAGERCYVCSTIPPVDFRLWIVVRPLPVETFVSAVGRNARIALAQRLIAEPRIDVAAESATARFEKFPVPACLRQSDFKSDVWRDIALHTA